MSPSPRFIMFTEQMALLGRALMPAKKLTGDYEPEEFVRLRAFRVLAHAEVEAFLEDRVLEVAQEACRLWKEERKANSVLLGLLAFYSRKWPEPKPSIERQQNQDYLLSVEKRIKAAVTAFHQSVIDNNGIKEKNLLELLLPVGIAAEELDNYWVGNMNTYGVNRGEVAHRSGAVQSLPNPVDEAKAIVEIAAGLQALDVRLDAS